MNGTPAKTVADETIKDFGAQWTRYTSNTGYYGSTDLLADLLHPLVELDEIRDRRVGEIGSGTGRIVNMLVEAGVASVVALEPSRAFHVLQQNTERYRDRIQYVHGVGEDLPPSANLDFVFSMGVLHHIAEPKPVVNAAFRALRPGGSLVVWVYGLEGNEQYVRLVRWLRMLTVRCPDFLLSLIAKAGAIALAPYIFLAKRFRVPMRGYLVNTFAKLSWDQRELVIFDQLNPRHAKYYSRAEVSQLLESCGFVSIRLHHRHGYSWTARAWKPENA